MSYVIGSFNMYKFSYRDDKEIKKEYDRIANIIKDEGFQIVALQEVFNKYAVKRLTEHLGRNWKFSWDQPRSRSDQQAEGYAFIWNSDMFGLVPTKEEHSYRSKPIIYQQYSLDKSRGQIRLSRDPYYARFSPVKNEASINVELRLINTHIRYTGDDEIEVKDLAQRRNEYDVLVRSILNAISNKKYGNNYVGYTVLLGDYNLNLYGANTLDQYVAISYGSKACFARTVQDQLTTINRNNDGLSNNYDHFTYNEGNFEGVGAKWEAVNTVAKYFGNDYAEYKKSVSDHLPIKLTIDLRNGR